MRVDWDTAWSLAQERNESLSIARADAELSRYRVKEAYSSAMPSVEMNGTFNHYFEIPSNPVTMPGELNFSNPGQPFTVNFQFGQENNVGGSIQLTQPVWLAGKVGLALKVAKDYEKISRLGVQVSREDLRVMLLQSFYGTIIAEEFLQTANDALAQAKRYKKQVQEMFDQGVVSEYDLIRAGVAVSNLKPQVSQAEASHDLAIKGLKSLIGVELDREIEITGDLEVGLAPPSMPYESASQMALENRLELNQLQLQKNLYNYQYEIESRNWLWPNFLVGLRYETTAQSPDMNFAKYRFLNGLGAQVIVQVPLFDGFASKNRAQQAKVNMKKVDLQLKQAKRGIEVQVFQSMREFQRSSEELVAAEENVLQAKKGYKIAQSRYSGGVGTQIEVLDAQLQLNQSKVMLLQAKYNKLVAKAQYDRAIGKDFTLEPEE
ncbi:TolC family protein [bacterium]|nr:TolC family protein [bacterium]